MINDMGKTSVDARRHIREWSAFFRDVNAAGVDAVEHFILQHRKRKYLRQSLKRLIERGFVRERDGNFSPTQRGLRFFHRHTSQSQKPLRWDGKWRLISFDVPGGYNVARDQIRALLREFDFYQLHKSVWVSPNSLAGEFWKSLVESDLDKYCKAMVVDILEGDEKLRKHFKIGT